ncbi:MAG: hypothetical protein J3Q66DRAFT_187474 [Benniella sp.]|nr:MAG: hypothetical protein J3Q66DRAFT_187474 [Benniella sp.]
MESSPMMAMSVTRSASQCMCSQDSRLVWMSVSKEYVTWSYPEGLNSPLYVYNSPNQPKYITDPGVQKIADLHTPMSEIPGTQPLVPVLSLGWICTFGMTKERESCDQWIRLHNNLFFRGAAAAVSEGHEATGRVMIAHSELIGQQRTLFVR